MKVISIIQPWATLIAVGEKSFETRSWKTNYRGILGIHASKNIDKKMCRREPFRSILAKHGYNEMNLPIGAIVATCQIEDCLKVDIVHNSGAILENGFHVTENEYIFGYYREGRYAWKLKGVKQIDLIPVKGQLGLWNYELQGVIE